MKKFLLKMSCLLTVLFMLGAISCSSSSSDDDESPKKSQPPEKIAEDDGTGTVSISVTVDGKYKCGICGTAYDTEEEAKNCGHSEACPAWEYTVVFNDAEGGTNTAETVKVKKGNKLSAEQIPSWTKEKAELSWTASVEGYTVASAIKSDVTFTAVWTNLYTVTFKDAEGGSNADVIKSVKEGSKIASGDIPAWTKAHYTLSWSDDTSAAITADTVFTAVWTENAKFTVTFKDSDVAGFTKESDDVQSVYDGENAAIPSWTKSGYNLAWESSVSDLTPTSAINANVTFTAKWTQDAITWVAGDVNPSWLNIAAAVSNSHAAFKKQNNNTVFSKAVELTDGAKFSITPNFAGTYVIYVCRDDNTKTGSVKASAGTPDTYNTVNRKTEDITPWSLVVTEDLKGQEITFTVTGKTKVFKIDIQ